MFWPSMCNLYRGLAKLAFFLVVAVVMSGCASDLKLGVATNEAPPTPEAPPR